MQKMSAIMSIFYPLWYRSYRMSVKQILEIDTNAAKILLDAVVAEHDNTSLANNDPDESSHLHHAQAHLDSFQQHSDQIEQKQATITALDE